jgi:uncharacterized protein involved in response to NO
MKPHLAKVLEEPYRIFFPLGVLAGIWGVMMWPMLYAGWLRFYPGEAHTRMMIEGFMGAFVVGFLGTAFPRLAGSRSWFGGELLAILVLWLLAVTSHAMGRVPAGDAAFSVMLLALFLGMAGRWFFENTDTPPPGFVLAMLGILGAAVSAWLLSRGGLGGAGYGFARLCLLQGFLLLPLMGIGPYLLPRFFGWPSRHSFDDSPTPPAGWWRKLAAAILAGLLVLSGFLLEARGNALLGQCLRALVILVWFAMETPILRRAKTSTTPANSVRWAIASMIAGLAAAAFWPAARIGSLHLFFACGLALATLAVGTRVILGHAGRHDLLGGKIVWLRWVTGLLILAAATRMTADFIPKVLVSHHIYAAWSWAIGAGLWLAFLRRCLWRSEEDKPKPSKCPRKQDAASGKQPVDDLGRAE